jgi:non-ribosomal peptide synthase protein (TIGR01720 family)
MNPNVPGELESRLADLSEVKRQILALRLAHAGSNASGDAHGSGSSARASGDAHGSGSSARASGRAALVAFLESASPRDDLGTQLRASLSRLLPEYMIPARFVVLEQIPRTASGKIDRVSLRRMAEAHLQAPSHPERDRDRRSGERTERTASTGAEAAIPDIAGTAPPNGAGTIARSAAAETASSGAATAASSGAEAILARIWRDVLGIDSVGREESFFELGGDSILSIRVIARAREAGLDITPRQFHDSPTIGALAALADRARELRSSALPESSISSGAVPLTPIQHWFFEYVNEDPHHWNQAVLLEIPPEIEGSAMRNRLSETLAQLDVFRLCFSRSDQADARSEWRQTLAPDAPQIPFEIVDLSGLRPEAHSAAIAEVEARLHLSFDLAQPPLARAAFFRLGTGLPGHLLLVIHHLIVDGISWAILLEEMERRLAQQPSVAPPAPFSKWARHLQAHAETVRDELDHWLQLGSPSASIPTDLSSDRRDNRRGDADHVVAELDRATTQKLLRDVPEAYRTQVNDLLLCALVTAFSGWTGSSSLRVSLESHGRHPFSEELDLSGSVGWFTTVFPVELRVDGADDVGARLKAVKEQLRRIPRQGIGHGILRYLSADGSIRARLRNQRDPDVMFNYLGQRSRNRSGLRRIRDAGPGARSARALRPCWIEIDSYVEEGAFHARWTYGTRIHHRQTIQSLADRFHDALRDIVRHCEEGHTGATPSDFPLAGLGQAELDRIAGLLRNEGSA